MHYSMQAHARAVRKHSIQVTTTKHTQTHKIDIYISHIIGATAKQKTEQAAKLQS